MCFTIFYALFKTSSLNETSTLFDPSRRLKSEHFFVLKAQVLILKSHECRQETGMSVTFDPTGVNQLS